MKYDLVVLSTETLDSHPSVGLFFKDKLYVFNVPDQAQRVFFEIKFRFAKLAHVFLTTLNARAIGGFHGLTITSFDSKNNILNYSGLPGFKEILESYSNLHTQLKLRPKLVENFKDFNIKVTDHILKSSIAYEVRLPDIPGKFLADKADALGLKPGPLFKVLASGKPVLTPQGAIVTPGEVLAPSTKGDVIFVVDCQSIEDINVLPDIASKCDFVVHFTSIELLMTPEYLSHFDANQNCICFSPSERITFSSVSNLYAAISAISPSLILPLVCFEKEPIVGVDIPEGFINALPSMEYAFAPPEKKRFVFPEQVQQTQVLEENNCLLPKFDSFMVTFLGTGAMFPSKYRNVAGILLHTESGFIILDAGEGITGQLRRRFGKNNFKIILQNLICIWISHLHGDHHFGLYQLLQARAEVCDTKIPLICQKYIVEHMETLQKNLSPPNESLKFEVFPQKDKFVSGNISIDSIPVTHCIDSHGCLVTLDGGWKVAYSGDRTDSDDFTTLVGTCDLLIHEASFTDDLIDTAREKRHSTMGQALAAGKATNAKYIILTHFSQRYPKLPVFGTEFENVAFAFDYLSVAYEKLGDLCKVCPQIFQMIQDLEANDDKFERVV